MATALLWSQEQDLQEDFTSEVKEAWVAAYTALSGTMKSAAAGQGITQTH